MTVALKASTAKSTVLSDNLSPPLFLLSHSLAPFPCLSSQQKLGKAFCHYKRRESAVGVLSISLKNLHGTWDLLSLDSYAAQSWLGKEGTTSTRPASAAAASKPHSPTPAPSRFRGPPVHCDVASVARMRRSPRSLFPPATASRRAAVGGACRSGRRAGRGGRRASVR